MNFMSIYDNIYNCTSLIINIQYNMLVRDLNNIVDSIKDKNLKQALELCDLYENKENKYIIFNFRGAIHLLKKDLNLAEASFLESNRLNEKFEDPIKNLYLLYLKKKRFKQVLLCANKLMKIDKSNHRYNYQLAFALELNNNFNEAIKYYKICIDFNNNDKKKSLNNIGSIYLKISKPKIALGYFRQAIELGEDKIIVNNLLKCYIKLRDIDKANLYYKKAQKIDKDYIEFIFNKVEFLILKNQIKDALIILEKNKNKSKFLISLLRLLFNVGKNDEGKKLLTQSKKDNEQSPDFFNYFSLRLLYDGNFEDGWKYYEHRLAKKINYFNNIKEWAGENIEKKNIIVFSEQGLGDCIQFSKYLIPLTQIAKNVTFVTQSKLLNLFRKKIKNLSIDVIENCKNQKFDFKITLGSLIKFFFKEKINNNESLIQSNRVNDLKWKNKFSNSKMNIGLVWSGSFNGTNEPYRSIPLSSLKKILSLNANFYCLQNEIWDRDLDFFRSTNLIDYGKLNLDEIASIINNLDLVITVDTSILHLSASLNKETWGLFSLNPDWRWGEFNKFNPYKSLNIFKQKTFNKWNDIEDQIYEKLKKKLTLS